MFIQPRKPRRTSRFRSGRMRTERERKEYVASLYVSAAIRASLGVALLIAGLQAFRAAQTHAEGLSLGFKLFMPVAFAVGALFALRSGLRTFQEGREIMAAPLVKDPDDDDDPPPR